MELATPLRRLGFIVFEELRAPTSTSFVKPDLIAVRDRRATVIDVSIVSDGRGVTVWNEKKQYVADEYSFAIVSALHAIGCDVDFLVHQPMIISYRRICFPQSANAVIGLELPKVTVSDLWALCPTFNLVPHRPSYGVTSLVALLAAYTRIRLLVSFGHVILITLISLVVYERMCVRGRECTERSPKASLPKAVSVRDAHSLHSFFKFVIDEIMRRTLEGLQNPGVQTACEENFVDLEYADDIILMFKEEEKTRVFLDELT
ncbi:hypothetical protein T265_08748 [Opisthorchis viverrini]|uniref:Reverse transcriptase domain-containing protein n=1 Tax=Opisthorchis viverrini TaxID=6198 RepID=A0A074Z802_OPIVI|nr:hypothetical protein T265_08748 [Opisthorchis viverrini]KER23336.1 hypothetical protein T265_08748 [Opisthorchis viverrini]